MFDSESVQPSYSNASQKRSFLFPLLFISPKPLTVAEFEFKESEGGVEMLGCRKLKDLATIEMERLNNILDGML